MMQRSQRLIAELIERGSLGTVRAFYGWNTLLRVLFRAYSPPRSGGSRYRHGFVCPERRRRIGRHRACRARDLRFLVGSSTVALLLLVPWAPSFIGTQGDAGFTYMAHHHFARGTPWGTETLHTTGPWAMLRFPLYVRETFTWMLALHAATALWIGWILARTGSRHFRHGAAGAALVACATVETPSTPSDVDPSTVPGWPHTSTSPDEAPSGRIISASRAASSKSHSSPHTLMFTSTTSS